MDHFSEISSTFFFDNLVDCASLDYILGRVNLVYCHKQYSYDGRYLCQIPDRGRDQHTHSDSSSAGQQIWPSLSKVMVNVTMVGQHNGAWSPVSCPSDHLTHIFLACDVLTSCWAGSDVTFSFYPDTWALPTLQSCPVTSLPPSFSCRSEEQRVPYSLMCDHRRDCVDGSDETFCKFLPCNQLSQFECLNKQVSLVHSLCLNQ